MRVAIAVGALFASIILAADLPCGFIVLTPQQLTEAARAMAAEPGNRGLAVKTMEVMKSPAAPSETFAPNTLLLVDRSSTGESEIHQTEHDILSVISGSATLIMGGTIVAPRNTGATEVRGDSIQGGVRGRAVSAHPGRERTFAVHRV